MWWRSLFIEGPSNHGARVALQQAGFVIAFSSFTSALLGRGTYLGLLSLAKVLKVAL